MDTHLMNWAQAHWGTCELGDERLTRRAVQVGARLVRQPNASLPHQMEGHSELLGAYRLLGNVRANEQKLWAPSQALTRRAAEQERCVLWIHDRTSLDYSHHPATQGVGSIGSRRQRGLLMQSVVAVVPAGRRVVGFGHGEIIIRAETRPKQAHGQRRGSAEGAAWETGVKAIGAPPPDVQWVHVSDRESDIFEYLTTCRAYQTDFVVRAFRERTLVEAADTSGDELLSLFARVRAWLPVADSAYTVDVPATKTHPAREATIQLSWGVVTLRPPHHCPEVAPLTVTVVRAWEIQPPATAEPVEWILLTSCPVTDVASARERVRWYECRWLIEDFHQCLKTGCRIEHSQLDHADDLRRLLGFLVPIAVRLLQLRQEARSTPSRPATDVIEPLRLQLLARHFKIPLPATVTEFWRYVARLGGHLGRKHDGPPGWRTLWRGWVRLDDWYYAAQILQVP